MRTTLFIFGLLFTLAACTPEPQSYEEWVAEEMEKEERVDSLFLDIHFGMEAKDFYEHCWNLNRAGTLTDGNGNATARYRLETELDYPADFEFYPTFVDGQIVAMPAFVEYDGWAPWNKHLAADKLIEKTRTLLEEWYGIEFRPVKRLNLFGKAYVNIQGNRKILLYYSNDNRVEILYTDLTAVEDTPNELL